MPSNENPTLKGIEMEEAINPFFAHVHDMVSDADLLIDIYTQTHEYLKAIGAPAEGLMLTEKTIETLMRLKVTVTELTEHSAKIDDKLTEILDHYKRDKE